VKKYWKLSRLLLLIIVVSTQLLGTGFKTKPINRETLSYFYSLVNQQFWQREPTSLALNDEYGTEQLILAA